MERMHKVIVLIVFLLFAKSIFAEEVQIDTFVGEVKVLGEFKVDRIAIGNGKIIKVEVKEGGEIILIGQAAGSSSLRLWKKDGSQVNFNVRVSSEDPDTRIRMENMIRVNVKIIEIRKSAIKNIGLDWLSLNEGKLNGPSFSTAGDFISNNMFRNDGDSGISESLPLNVKPFSTHFGLATSINTQINYLASSGDALTLAEPNLSCVNGGSAKFLAGGEVPYPVTGQNGQTSVQFKEYGIKLEINPLVDSQNNIFARIKTEVSQIDPAVAVLGAPGLLSRKTETQVNVVSGQTIVISGLLNADHSNDINKVPLLGDIPIIGELFKSKNFRNNMSELVVFVTPEVVDPIGHQFYPNERAIYQRADKLKKHMQDNLEFNLMD